MGYSKDFNEAKNRSPYAASTLLWSWLQDDVHRPALFADLRVNQPVLEFQSRAAAKDPGSKGVKFHQSAFLLTRQADIARALANFSNGPYKAIGSGTFVLSSNNGEDDKHEEKRAFLGKALRYEGTEIDFIAAIACRHAMILPKTGEQFDMVTDVAEQAALRFVTGLFGYPDSEHYVLQQTMRATYDAMILQMFSRHFITEPLILPMGNRAMGKLAQVTGSLIDEASAPRLAMAVADLLHTDEANTKQHLEQATNQILQLEPELGRPVDDYCAQLKLGVDLAYHTANFLNEALNYRSIREDIADSLIDALPDTDLANDLISLVEGIITEKQAPDENLIPCRRGDAKYTFRQTVMDKLVNDPAYIDDPEKSYTGAELVTNIVGSIAGLVGNITAGACITINELFLRADEGALERAMAALASVDGESNELRKEIAGAKVLEKFVKEAMRLHPPAAFVPRLAVGDEASRTFKDCDGNDIIIPEGAEVIIPLGAATRDEIHDPDKFDENRRDNEGNYIFGHESADPTSHRCLGEFISTPLIAHVVRSVLSLPGLAQKIDEKTGDPITLKKKWGYICESFPLQYDHDLAVVQKPLNMIMKVRAPVTEHAERLKLVIQYGAPLIENLLKNSKIVHFARFVFLNNETELALFTTYDGAFEPYVEHFAQVAGPLFDQIFEHVQNPPPRPVRDNLTEFVATMKEYDVKSVGGYFFSAYPKDDVGKIVSKE